VLHVCAAAAEGPDIGANQVDLVSSNRRKLSDNLIYGAKALSYKPEGRFAQPLTEMSTRKCFWGVERSQCVGLTSVSRLS
jgi:hypothetical protein